MALTNTVKFLGHTDERKQWRSHRGEKQDVSRFPSDVKPAFEAVHGSGAPTSAIQLAAGGTDDVAVTADGLFEGLSLTDVNGNPIEGEPIGSTTGLVRKSTTPSRRPWERRVISPFPRSILALNAGIP